MNSYKNNFSKIFPLLILTILLTSCGNSTNTQQANSSGAITSNPIIDQTDSTTTITQNTVTIPTKDNNTNSVIYQQNVSTTTTPIPPANTNVNRKINTVTKAS